VRRWKLPPSCSPLQHTPHKIYQHLYLNSQIIVLEFLTPSDHHHVHDFAVIMLAAVLSVRTDGPTTLSFGTDYKVCFDILWLNLTINWLLKFGVVPEQIILFFKICDKEPLTSRIKNVLWTLTVIYFSLTSDLTFLPWYIVMIILWHIKMT
jgi:hypothetical protein